MTVGDAEKEKQGIYDTQHHHSGAFKNKPAEARYYYVSDEDEESSSEIDTQAPRKTRSGAAYLSLRDLHVSDCMPVYTAMVAKASNDLRTNHFTPSNYREAIQSPDREHWIAAMNDELQALKDMNVYELIQLQHVPSECHVLRHTWVYKIKIMPDGTIARYKARICVDGSQQRKGLDFEETWAPVASAVSIRLVISLAVHYNMSLHQYDIKLAFVSAPIDRPVYMVPPTGSKTPKNTVWRLKRSLYGLKQAPRLFNAKLHSSLTSLGWFRSSYDACLYRFSKHGQTGLLAVVVDDILLATSTASLAETFKRDLGAIFNLKSLGRPEYIIGMHLNIQEDKISISQKQYITDLQDRFDETLMLGKPTQTPAPANLRLTPAGTAGSEHSLPADKSLYRALVGSLMYAVLTRPDIAAPVSMCARYLAEPTQAHLKQASRILRYLISTHETELVYHKTKQPVLCAYADASWGACPHTRRSRFGFAVFFGRSLISWRSKLHNCICLSTAEAEYISASEVTKELMWIRGTLSELGHPQPTSTIYEDNAAVIRMAENPMISGHNKHVALKMLYLRERVTAKDVHLVYVPTKHQRADLLTKTLARHQFEYLRNLLLDPITASPAPLHEDSC